MRAGRSGRLDVVPGHLTWSRKVAAAVRRWLGLPTPATEDLQQNDAPLLNTEVEPAPLIDTEVEPARLHTLLKHVENCWHRLGETEPHWSVLTELQFKSDRMAESSGDFYTGGEYDVRLFKEAAYRCGVSLPLKGTCFELGCGVGRVTTWLSRSFNHVIGVDISPSHLALAEQTLREGRCHNVELHLVNRLSAFDHLPRFDSFFSVIVLQHNPPPVMRWLLATILSKLETGGIGFFQLPTSLPHYSFDAAAYLAQPPTHGLMEMHALPYHAVLEILDKAGCELLEARDHTARSPASVSLSFLVLKSRNPK
jgi:SAM-dependent methyltransferase